MEFRAEHEQKRGDDRDGNPLEDESRGDQTADAVGDQERRRRRQREGVRVTDEPLDAEDDGHRDDEQAADDHEQRPFEDGEHRRHEAHQRERPDTGRLVGPLPLEAQEETERRRQHQLDDRVVQHRDADLAHRRAFGGRLVNSC